MTGVPLVWRPDDRLAPRKSDFLSLRHRLECLLVAMFALRGPSENFRLLVSPAMKMESPRNTVKIRQGTFCGATQALSWISAFKFCK
jgi:hypothetical protein